MRHTGGWGWVWRETCSLGDCPLVTAAHNSCHTVTLSLSLCVVTVTVCSWLLSVLCSPSNSGTGSTLTDIINTPRLRLRPESRLWPGAVPHTSDGWSRTLTTGRRGQTDATQQPPALRRTGTLAKTENSLQLKQLLTNCTITLLATKDQF